MALLYQDNTDLRSLKALLHLPSAGREAVNLVSREEGEAFQVVRQLVVDREEGYRPTLRELSDMGAKNLVLACSKDILWHVLNQAQQIGLITQQVQTTTLTLPQFNWILTNLDAHTVDFRPFKYDFTNFTVMRMVDYSKPFVQYSLKAIVREARTRASPLGPGDHDGTDARLHRLLRRAGHGGRPHL